jgi:hypothetical protein
MPCAIRSLHRGSDGLGFGQCLNDRRGRLLLLSWKVYLADGPDTFCNGLLVLCRFSREYGLRPFGHLDGEHENPDRNDGKHADDEGIHVKEFLVPTQGNAPEIVS